MHFETGADGGVNGGIVVIPATRRTMDYDGVDKKLGDCHSQMNTVIEMYTESALYDQDEHERAIAASAVTHEWLVQQGANGLEMELRPSLLHHFNAVGSG